MYDSLVAPKAGCTHLATTSPVVQPVGRHAEASDFRVREPVMTAAAKAKSWLEHQVNAGPHRK
jgi:hypothetical protein